MTQQLDELAPPCSRRPDRRLVTFHGYVTGTATPAGTAITHREEFDFHGPLRPVAERWLGAWLAADVSAEVERMHQILNGPEAAQR